MRKDKEHRLCCIFWWNGQWGFNEDGYWVDENGVNRGKCYQLTNDVPGALKLVGKVNFASSAQSHKIGSTALFNDLFKAVCGGNSITNTEGFENCRVAVLQKPFLFFVQEDENSEPQFKSFMTFGPGKGRQTDIRIRQNKISRLCMPGRS